MLFKAFTIYDSKTEASAQPFFATTTGHAIRMFTDTVNDPNTLFNKHADDFTLFEIGTFDDQNGTFENLKAHINLGNAHEYIKQIEMPIDSGEQMKLKVLGE